MQNSTQVFMRLQLGILFCKSSAAVQGRTKTALTIQIERPPPPKHLCDESVRFSLAEKQELKNSNCRWKNQLQGRETTKWFPTCSSTSSACVRKSLCDVVQFDSHFLTQSFWTRKILKVFFETFKSLFFKLKNCPCMFVNNGQLRCVVAVSVWTLRKTFCSAHEGVQHLVDPHLFCLMIAEQNHQMHDCFLLASFFALHVVFESGELPLDHCHSTFQKLPQRSSLCVDVNCSACFLTSCVFENRIFLGWLNQIVQFGWFESWFDNCLFSTSVVNWQHRFADSVICNGAVMPQLWTIECCHANQSVKGKTQRGCWCAFCLSIHCTVDSVSESWRIVKWVTLIHCTLHKIFLVEEADVSILLHGLIHQLCFQLVDWSVQPDASKAQREDIFQKNLNHLHIDDAVNPKHNWIALCTQPLVLHQKRTRTSAPIASDSLFLPFGWLDAWSNCLLIFPAIWLTMKALQMGWKCARSLQKHQWSAAQQFKSACSCPVLNMHRKGDKLCLQIAAQGILFCLLHLCLRDSWFTSSLRRRCQVMSSRDMFWSGLNHPAFDTRTRRCL